MRLKMTCQNCRKWRTPQCDERKQTGENSEPGDWCAGWKKKDVEQTRRR